MMSLYEALSDIASAYNLHPGELAEYANEDNIGGWDENKGGWPVGSIWSVEGKVLYALVRALKPKVCVELGTYHGCSATHIAAALKANGNLGHIYCVENGGYGLAQPDLVPDDLQAHMTFVKDDAALYMENFKGNGVIDFIFEDSAHNEEVTRRVWKAAQEKLAPGGVIISHDAMHDIGPEGKAIRTGILESGITDARFYPIEPSDCGLAIWRKGFNYEPSDELKAEFADAREAYKDMLRKEGELAASKKATSVDKPKRTPAYETQTAVYGGVEQSLKELGVEIKKGRAPVDKPKRKSTSTRGKAKAK